MQLRTVQRKEERPATPIGPGRKIPAGPSMLIEADTGLSPDERFTAFVKSP